MQRPVKGSESFRGILQIPALGQKGNHGAGRALYGGSGIGRRQGQV